MIEKLPFEKCFIDVTGGNLKTKQSDYLKEGTIPIIDQGKEFIGGYTNDRTRIVKCKIPCLVFGDHSRKIKYLDTDFAIGADGVKLLETTELLSPKFGYYFLQTVKLPEAGYDRSFKYLKRIEVPVLPMEVQNKIVAVLDSVSSLVTKRKESIELLDKLLRDSFLDIFGDPVKSTKISTRITLGKLGDWKSGGTPSRGIQKYFAGEIPWVTSGELNQIYIDNAKEKITQNALDNSNAKLIEIGSLLLGMYDTAALKSSITRNVVACNQAIAYAKLDDKLCDTHFVYYNIQLGREYFKSQQRGVRQQNLNLSMIKGIEILYPSLSKQKGFSKIVIEVYDKKQRLIQSQNQIIELNQSIFQKAFNGQLNFNIDFELDALIQEIDLQKKENNLSKIVGDIAYLQRLVDKLNTQEFKEKDLYGKAKHGAFQLMAVKEEERKIIQEYDENSKSLKLVLK